MLELHYFCSLVQFLILKRILVRFFLKRMATTSSLQALHRRTHEAKEKRKTNIRIKAKNPLGEIPNGFFVAIFFFAQLMIFLLFFVGDTAQ